MNKLSQNSVASNHYLECNLAGVWLIKVDVALGGSKPESLKCTIYRKKKIEQQIEGHIGGAVRVMQ